MINFDRDFERYLAEWYAKLTNRQDEEWSADELLELAPDVYNEWANTNNPQLSGVSPRAYFASIDSEQELLALFLENPCALLYDRIAEVPACTDGLIALIETHESTETRQDAVELLNEMGIQPPLKLYAQIVASPDSPSPLADRCTEILSEYAAEAASMLYDLIDSADEVAQSRIAEVLLNAPQDPRTLKLLTALFQTGNHTAQYAAYLGKYGDLSAVQLLYQRLDRADSHDYMELRNAIESLGGVVDGEPTR